MRRPLSIALASLFIAALVAPTAQGATRRYDFETPLAQERLYLHIIVLYKNKQPHGRYTPRQASYGGSVPVSCNPPVAEAAANTGSGENYVKLRKGSFTYSYSSVIPVGYGYTPGSITATGTGKVIKKKPGVSKQLRVDGSVSILDYSLPPFGHYNCTSGGPVAYSVAGCRQQTLDLPYIKKSLPLCSRGP